MGVVAWLRVCVNSVDLALFFFYYLVVVGCVCLNACVGLWFNVVGLLVCCVCVWFGWSRCGWWWLCVLFGCGLVV